MKNIFRLFFGAIITASLFTACDKKKDLGSFADGKDVVLTSSVTSVAPARADSNNTAITFSWTDPVAINRQ